MPDQHAGTPLRQKIELDQEFLDRLAATANDPAALAAHTETWRRAYGDLIKAASLLRLLEAANQPAPVGAEAAEPPRPDGQPGLKLDRDTLVDISNEAERHEATSSSGLRTEGTVASWTRAYADLRHATTVLVALMDSRCLLREHSRRAKP